MPNTLAKKQAYHRAYWQAHKHLYAKEVPPGQYLAHCQVWQEIRQIPHACTVCGTQFFTTREP